MRWERINEWLVRRPDGYSIAKFLIGSQAVFRASFKGQFIGPAGAKEQALEHCREHAKAQ